MAYFVIFYTITAGQNGPMLGTDEEEIVFLIYLVYDGVNDKIIAEKLLFVKPRTADINENILSDECRADYILNETLIKSSQSLESVIEEFDQYLKRDLTVDDETSFILVTDGQLHLRQCLHPEACSKNIELPEYYNTFFDLRKEFMKFYKNEEAPLNVTEMLKFLNIQPLNSENLGVSDSYNMVKIIQRLLEDGHEFSVPETVNMKLEPGICSKNEEIESNCVVRARGLPWQSSDQDIAKFFRGLNVAKGGVALCLSPQGRRNGEALVRFINREHRDMALKRHKHHIGNRYIEVYKATGEDFVNVAGGSNNEAQAFLSRGGLVIVRMRGLPYDCTARQVEEFFEQGEKSCSVMDGEDGVLFVKKPDGRATGDAFVMFAREEDAANALSKHREIIGFRYIELFRSTTAEVQQVLNRSMDPRTYEQQQPLISQIPQVPQLPIIPQQVITAGTKKDCVRLRGLPYEAQVEHVIDFLGEHSKSIVLQGAHLVYNAQGQPSGEAFIQMDSEASAQMCAQQKHHKYMTFGKKQRYIEVFQCSGDDMNLVLTGGLPAASQRPLLSPGGTLMASPFGAYPYCAGPQIIHAAVNPITPRPPMYGFSPVFYFPYPSPPVSPTSYYNGSISNPPALAPHSAVPGPASCALLM